MYRDLKWEGGEEGRGNNDVRDVRTSTVSYGARERVGCSVFVLVLYCLLWYYTSSMVRGQYSTDAMQCRVGAVQCVGAVHMLSYIRQLQVRLELHRTARHCTALHILHSSSPIYRGNYKDNGKDNGNNDRQQQQ